MSEPSGSLSAFLAVAELKSFRAAGERLGITSSAVSQSVRQLEERLGVALFARTTRSVALTEAGDLLERRLRPALAEVDGALASIEELRRRPAGLLRLSVSSVAETFLGPGLLAGFLAEYPDIRLDIAIEDADFDVVRQGFDAGVQLGEVVARDMVAVRVSPSERQIVVGAPGYLAAHGRPRHPRDLHRHSCIGWRVYSQPSPYRWEFTDAGKEIAIEIEARVNTSDMGVMLQLALDGVGLTAGLERTFQPYLDRGELVAVLDRFCPPFPGFFLYYARRTRTPAKLAALVDYLRRRSPAPPAGRRPSLRR